MSDKLFGVQLKHISLVVLVVQNSLLVLVMRYSRMVAGLVQVTTGPAYLPSTAVVMSEGLKFVICLGMYLWEESKVHKVCFEIHRFALKG